MTHRNAKGIFISESEYLMQKQVDSYKAANTRMREYSIKQQQDLEQKAKELNNYRTMLNTIVGQITISGAIVGIQLILMFIAFIAFNFTAMFNILYYGTFVQCGYLATSSVLIALMNYKGSVE
jgi:hypothetical protein